ncbi:outer membrane beta-barrel protein [Grimontia hollisae]|uniref:outer membrane beta-barrel protein n=1 Tax=Grimontia hollisae TaxID=673 RepID=UPI0013039CE6|nr:outer membrane beta-barrel protein [Grimontia hollisae]
MVKRKTSPIAVASLLIAALTVPQAVADLYAGALVGYSNVEHTQTATNQLTETSPILLQAQAGYFFNDYLAVEGRFGTSLKRTDGLVVNGLASGYVKGNIPVTNQIAMYALAGYVVTDIDHHGTGSVSDSCFSFGLGAHYALSSETAVTLEFVNAPAGDNLGISALNLGFQYRF